MKNKEKRQTRARAFLIIAIILFTSSMLMLTLRNQVLNAQLYKDALSQSHIYEITADILESEISKILVAWEKKTFDDLIGDLATGERPVIESSFDFILGYVIEKQTPQVVSSVFEKIQVEKILQNITEKSIDRDIAWFRGEGEGAEIFQYIPTPEQIGRLQEGDIDKIIGAIFNPKKKDFIERALPVCATNTEILENVQRILQGNSRGITCTSEQISQLEKQIIESELIEETSGTIQTKVDKIISATMITGIFSDIYDVSLVLSSLKQKVINLRSIIQAIYSIAIFFLIASIGFVIASVIISKKNIRLRVLAIMFSVSGGMLIILTITHYLVFASMISRVFLYDQIIFGTEALTVDDGIMLANSIQSIIIYVAQGIMRQTFIVGLLLLGVGGLFFIAFSVYKNHLEINSRILDPDKKLNRKSN